jgi:hypothetical protein
MAVAATSFIFAIDSLCYFEHRARPDDIHVRTSLRTVDLLITMKIIRVKL